MISRRKFGHVTISAAVAHTLAGRAARAAEPAAKKGDLAAATPALPFDPATHDAAIRNVVWSWTTAEQAKELRAEKLLLRRSESPTLGPGYLFTHLQRVEGAAAKLLRDKRYAKGRFGWINPWATSQGFAGETYGGELIRIQLKPGARFAKVFTRGGDLKFVDMRNATVSNTVALAAPDRVAGVYFVNDAYLAYGTGSRCDSGGNPTMSGNGARYREIYLGNEGMIESWSLATVEMREELERNIAMLSGFEAVLRKQEEERDAKLESEVLAAAKKEVAIPPYVSCTWGERAALSSWKGPVSELSARYEASLAFLDEAHYPSAANVKRMVSTVSARLFEPAPFTYRPGQ